MYFVSSSQIKWKADWTAGLQLMRQFVSYLPCTANFSAGTPSTFLSARGKCVVSFSKREMMILLPC
jgi:hypothetical protein